MKDKIKKIIEKHEVLHENGTYWNDKLLKDNIAKMYEDLFALYGVVTSKKNKNSTNLEKIKVLTNTLETFRNIPYTTDAIKTTIKKIDKLIDEL